MIQANGMVDRVAEIAEELKMSNLQPQIAACRQHMYGPHGIDVAVFGRFKAGKTLDDLEQFQQRLRT
ncbi:MAG TPA: hypothetical protein P5555_10270 [Candidatus Paceibacterota bacterium]|nr:hypothetical protein [Verrucomicrobiota bacterium]HRZ45563.1 hypothetical protein [Candidatus Paceibacterota bacterium]